MGRELIALVDDFSLSFAPNRRLSSHQICPRLRSREKRRPDAFTRANPPPPSQPHAATMFGMGNGYENISETPQVRFSFFFFSSSSSVVFFFFLAFKKFFIGVAGETAAMRWPLYPSVHPRTNAKSNCCTLFPLCVWKARSNAGRRHSPSCRYKPRVLVFHYSSPFSYLPYATPSRSKHKKTKSFRRKK